LLKEIRTIGKITVASSLPNDVLARVDRIMQQAVKETRSNVKGAMAMARRTGLINDRLRQAPAVQSSI